MLHSVIHKLSVETAVIVNWAVAISTLATIYLYFFLHMRWFLRTISSRKRETLPAVSRLQVPRCRILCFRHTRTYKETEKKYCRAPECVSTYPVLFVQYSAAFPVSIRMQDSVPNLAIYVFFVFFLRDIHTPWMVEKNNNYSSSGPYYCLGRGLWKCIISSLPSTSSKSAIYEPRSSSTVLYMHACGVCRIQ